MRVSVTMYFGLHNVHDNGDEDELRETRQKNTTTIRKIESFDETQ